MLNYYAVHLKLPQYLILQVKKNTGPNQIKDMKFYGFTALCIDLGKVLLHLENLNIIYLNNN